MDSIAIVGISCLFPGAHNPEQYWQQLINERDLTSTATAAELGADPALFYSPELDQRDKTYYLRGGYLRDFTFDPTGYRVSADILEGLDELFQWSLHVARAALQDSGYVNRPEALARCGVIMGNLSFPTASSYRLLSPLYRHGLEQAIGELLAHPEIALNGEMDNGNASGNTPAAVNALASGYPTALIAQALGLGGSHFSLDAACASSLYAVKLACDYLLSGKADLMLAGGISRADHLFLSAGFSTFHAYPQNGQSNPLDRNSGGLTTGEGAGMVALKRHADAVRDGDHIYAVVRGIGLANDGRGKHLLTPNTRGQVLTLERAYADAGMDPATVDYVECHATGTPVGDVTELNSMASFFGPHQHVPRVGSAKSNMGHLLTAAGMAGLLKTVLSMNHGQIPATIHVDEPLSSESGVLSPEHIVSQRMEWPRSNGTAGPRRAGVSAFGFGGTNAHVVLEENTSGTQSGTQTVTQAHSSSEVAAPAPQLAIVGMDAFFGNSRGLSAFERTIYDGTQHFTPLPDARWKGIEAQTELLQQYGLADGAPQGAYIDRLDFDALRMRIPPNDAEKLNPQQLLMLHVADNALRDAGVDAGSDVAVIVAMAPELSLHTFLERYHLSRRLQRGLADAKLTLPPDELAALESAVKDAVHHPVETNEYVSVIGSVMANRISSLWDFTGPSFTLSAEENSAFKALEVAQMLLANGALDAVVIGAVDLAGGVENVLLRNSMASVNSGNPSLSYEADSNGWLVGEGAGALVLKRYADAVEHGDRIYAAVDAVSVVQTTDAPSGETVQHAAQQALNAAGVTADAVGYVEMCGSGIPHEDEAELDGLLAAYRGETPLHCAVGSVKANVGHTFAAAGMASLIKTALCLYHRFVPATPGWNAPAAAERWQSSPFYVATDSAPWHLPPGVTQRRAAVNGLGMDGASAHVLLSSTETFAEHDNDYLSTMPLQLFPVTGDNEADLLAQLDALEEAAQSGRALAEIAREYHDRAQQQRDATFAAALVGRNAKELGQEIKMARSGLPRAFAGGDEWKTPRGSYFTADPQGRTGKVAFVYPGAFTSYLGMERGLLHMFPHIYPQSADLTDDLSFGLDQYLYPRRVERMDMEAHEQLEAQFMDDATAMLKAGTITAFGYTTILQDCFGLHPDAAFGYSLGEFSMQFALGVWTSVDAASDALHSSPLFTTRLSGPKNAVREFFNMPMVEDGTTPPDSDSLWSTYVVLAPEERVREALAEEPGLYITHINAPGEVVIAGNKEACRRVIGQLGCDSFRAPFTDVLHSEVMRSEYDAFVELFDLPVQRVPDFTLYSAAHYAPSSVDRASIGPGIAEALCKPLDFPQLIERTYADGVRIFIEVGPGSTCSRWIRETLKAVPHSAMSINGRGMNNHTALLKVLGQLFSHRTAVDLSPLYAAPAAEQRPGIIKTVTLGEKRMADAILSDENVRRFRPQVVSLPEKTPAVETVPTEVAPAGTAAVPAFEKMAETTASRPSDAQMSQPAPAPEETVEPVAEPQATPSQSPVFAEQMLRAEQLAEHMQRVEGAHLRFLEGRQTALQGLGQLVQQQQSLAQQLLGQPNGAPAPAMEPPSSSGPLPVPPSVPPIEPPPALRSSPVPEQDVLFDEQDILEFANGRIAPVFGEEYAIIDTYRRRVRLPGPPYLFMSRVTKLDAERGRYEPCSIRTEYDIPHGVWHTTAGQIPSSVAIEASHANMFLASYLGVDFQNRGERIYRALDGHVTFLGPMAREGETLICDVRIDSFAKSGDTQIFFYTYDCGVRELSGVERPLLTMGGIAGFFTDEELRQAEGMAGKKSINPKLKPKIEKRHFEPPLRPERQSFDEGRIAALGAGDVATCFGGAYQQHGRNPALRLPDPVFRMIDRIISVDAHGGEWGLGLAHAEKDLSLDGWYFQCHFKNDLCMPGTVVGEGCVQMVQFYLLYLGLQSGTTNARFQPIPDLKLIAQSRGQITPQPGTLTYKLEVTDIGLSPHPYVIGTVDVTFEGRVIARCKDLGLQLVNSGGSA